MLKKVLSVLFVLFIFATFVNAESDLNKDIPEIINIDGKTLKLNGSGIRKKFFFKIYTGALYTENKINNTNDLFKDNFNGIIRMRFLYKKVDSKKLRDAFVEDITHNTPEYINDEAIKKFINTFNFDTLSGDIVDIIIKDGKNVIVKYNGEVKNKIESKKLVEAVLKVWFGDKPVNDKLKKAMLGG